MHAPDTRVPLEETVSGFDALYREGTIKRLGLSNYTPKQVEEVVKVCHDKGFVLPSVFQGSYSAVARLAEDKLLPHPPQARHLLLRVQPDRGWIPGQDAATVPR